MASDGGHSYFVFPLTESCLLLQPDNCGATHIVIGDGGNEEGVENDYTVPQAAWSAYRDLAFGQASFVIVNETSAEWAWRSDDGTPIDQVWDPRFRMLGIPCSPVQTCLLLLHTYPVLVVVLLCASHLDMHPGCQSLSQSTSRFYSKL